MNFHVHTSCIFSSHSLYSSLILKGLIYIVQAKCYVQHKASFGNPIITYGLKSLVGDIYAAGWSWRAKLKCTHVHVHVFPQEKQMACVYIVCSSADDCGYIANGTTVLQIKALWVIHIIAHNVHVYTCTFVNEHVLYMLHFSQWSCSLESLYLVTLSHVHNLVLDMYTHCKTLPLYQS